MGNNKKDPKAIKKEQRTNLKKHVKSLAEAINKANKTEKSAAQAQRKDAFKGKKPFKPFNKGQDSSASSTGDNGNTKKPFTKKPFTKSHSFPNSNSGGGSNNAAGKLVGQKRKHDAASGKDKQPLSGEALKKKRQAAKPNFSLVSCYINIEFHFVIFCVNFKSLY